MQLCQPQGHHSRRIRQPLGVGFLGQIAIAGARKLLAGSTALLRKERGDFVIAARDHAV